MKKLLILIPILLLFFGCSRHSVIIPTPQMPKILLQKFKASPQMVERIPKIKPLPQRNTKKGGILTIDAKGHTGIITDMVSTKNGKFITSSIDKTIRIWNSNGTEERKILGQIGSGMDGAISVIALSPNEKFLVVGGSFKEIRIYDYKSGKLIKKLSSHSNMITDLSFSSDGKYLLSSSSDLSSIIWEIPSFRKVDTIHIYKKELRKAKIFKNGNNYFITSIGDLSKITLYSLKEKKVIKDFRVALVAFSFAISSKHIAIPDGSNILIYDLNLNLKRKISAMRTISDLRYSLDEKKIIVGGFETGINKQRGIVNIYDVNLNYKKITSFNKHTEGVGIVGFVNNEIAVSSTSYGNEVFLWNIKSRKILKKIEGKGTSIRSVDIKENHIFWTDTIGLNKNNFAIKKGLNLRNMIIKIENSHKFSFKFFSKKLFYKNFVISLSSNHHSFELRDKKGKFITNLVGGLVPVMALSGDKLITGSLDQVIKIWDLSKIKPNMEPMLNIFVSKDNEYVVWTKEGFFDASKGGAKYIGYHVNQGVNKEAKFVSVDKFYNKFYQPDLIQKALNGEDLSRYLDKDVNTILRTDGFAPTIKILSHHEKKSQKGDIEIDIKVCDNGGGVENLQLYRNGTAIKRLSKESRAFKKRKAINKSCFAISERVSLVDGVNTIMIKATNRGNTIDSNQESVTVEYNAPKNIKPNIHLITLSVDKYQDKRLTLNYANSDAISIIGKIEKIGKSVFDKVFTYSLKDTQVTRENILKKFKEVAQKVKAQDVFVLFISGHGTMENREYYFIPYNVSQNDDVTQKAISQKILLDALAEIPANKSVVLLDTCQSGGFEEGLENTVFKKFGTRSGRAILSASTKSQNAIEGYEGHGAFTHTMLKAIENNMVYGFDKKLSVSELADYVQSELPKKTMKKWNYKQNAKFFKDNSDMKIILGGK